MASGPVDEWETAALAWEDVAQDISRRNIFTRSTVTLPVKAGPVTEVSVDFRVTGLIVGPRKGVALLEVATGRVLFLSEGEEQDGIYVRKVHKTSVDIEVAGKPVRLATGGPGL